MGTRCITIILDERGDELVRMYRQFDGYPEGHGQELASYLDGFQIINGIGVDVPEKCANGMGCLAAQIITHFKNDHPLGGIYIDSVNGSFIGVDYIYTIYLDVGNIKIRCQSGGVRVPWLLFECTPAEFTEKAKETLVY